MCTLPTRVVDQESVAASTAAVKCKSIPEAAAAVSELTSVVPTNTAPAQVVPVAVAVVAVRGDGEKDE